MSTVSNPVSDDANFQHGVGAKVIADSVAPTGERLTTIEATFHRFVLAEFNTHRVFSRNSASSRAIPFSKQVERIMSHPAVPVSFPAEQRGMQGGEELDNQTRQGAEFGWIHARNSAVQHAKHLADLGVHKSVVNRILEPYMWHTVIVSATDWQGFWDQRVSPLAQPEIRVVAEQMLDVYNASEPTPLSYDDWHLPYIDDSDYGVAEDIVYLRDYAYDGTSFEASVQELLKQVSVARCARVSYLTHDGERAMDKDINLYERLVSARPLHASPLEHVATPTPFEGTPGNFRGWRQYRHIVERQLNA